MEANTDVRSEEVIRTEEISFEYTGKRVIDRLTLSVRRGERIGITGESGCGKSTLLKLIAGLYRPTGGRLFVCGESTQEGITPHISAVMQSPMLLPMTIYENITLGHKYSGEWIDRICKAASIDKWIASFPDGINTYLGDRANELSGGQAQRISLARALCRNGDVFLLDEPTSALDSDTALSVLEALGKCTEGKTVIHVTHQPMQLAGYDRVYAMNNGSLSEVGKNG